MREAKIVKLRVHLNRFKRRLTRAAGQHKTRGASTSEYTLMVAVMLLVVLPAIGLSGTQLECSLARAGFRFKEVNTSPSSDWTGGSATIADTNYGGGSCGLGESTGEGGGQQTPPPPWDGGTLGTETP